MTTILDKDNLLPALSIDETQVILAAEYCFFVRNEDVTPANVANLIPLPTAEVEEYLSSPSVLSELKDRGIAPSSDPLGYAEKQLSFLLATFNPLDHRPTTQILSDLGISLQEWYAWQRNPEFKQLTDKFAAEFFNVVGVFVDRTVAVQAIKGSSHHAKLYYDQRDKQMQSPRQIMVRLLDAVQRAVPDPEVQRRIAQEMVNTSNVVQGELSE